MRIVAIRVDGLEVEVTGDFGGRGESARAITYHVTVKSDASAADISPLLVDTDRVAEIQNTVRNGCAVTLEQSS